MELQQDLALPVGSDMDTNIDTAQIFAKIGNEQQVRNIIGALSFITQMKPGQKVNVKRHFTRDNNDVYQRIMRTLVNIGGYLFSNGETGESKDELLKFITEKTDETFELIYIYNRNKNNEFRCSVVKLLLETLRKLISEKQGIENIKQTYKDDSNFVARLDAFKTTLELRLAPIEKSFGISPPPPASSKPISIPPQQQQQQPLNNNPAIENNLLSNRNTEYIFEKTNSLSNAQYIGTPIQSLQPKIKKPPTPPPMKRYNSGSSNSNSNSDSDLDLGEYDEYNEDSF